MYWLVIKMYVIVRMFLMFMSENVREKHFKDLHMVHNKNTKNQTQNRSGF